MRGFFRIIWCPPLLMLVFWACQDDKIDFSADVKPILNKRCISCHGGVKRNADFSLLFRSDALDTVESGKPAIIPGDAAHSEMIRRLTATDPEVRMPYKEEQLSQEEIDILTRWIDQGAQWGDHWAYVAPSAVDVPKPGTLLSGFSSGSWAKNEIDYFVLQQLDKEKITPSPEADKSTLIRRVYLDLIGLPPTPEQAQKFMNDSNPDAYARTVDELLQSSRFGEKWASWWLDLARYSDTKGYERDVGRTIWRYRDWVINAFNNDMPFDQFTVEQLAGDLLANPTDDQLIATAFHRNTMNNDEGGTEDEEFRVAALIDRVSTTWEVWQSTTMACAQCHTHPYDPFVNEEYYKSMAFFNNSRDEDTEGEYPKLRMYEEADHKKLESITAWVREHANEKTEFEVSRFLKTLEPKFHPHDFDQFVNGELIDTKWLGIRSGGSARLKHINLQDKTQLIIYYWTGEPGGTIEIRIDKVDGQIIASHKIKTTSGKEAVAYLLKPVSGIHDLYFKFTNSRIPPENAVCGIEWFAFRDNLPGSLNTDFMQLLNVRTENTPVMIENNAEQHRKTYMFERGNWLVHGKEVTPGVPASLNPFPAGQPENRLGFARWLTDKNNPLTARSAVNRFWDQLFGYGLVETLEDFGTQGARPSHPELLDWLAVQFMNDYAWSMKKLVRTMVMSATYRQDSRVSNELIQRDQSNRLLARGPRVRLSSEQIRDQALAVGGLLSDKMYGKSVMPYQPDGIWSSVWSGEYWKKSEGEDQYRRSLYTYIKRTSPYPSMMMFDGSSREVCLSRRIRTNTPLQALVTLNDSTYIVASRSFANRMMATPGSPQDRIRSGYKVLLVHDIDKRKLDVFTRLYNDAIDRYQKDPAAAKKLLANEKPSPELAAMTVVASAMLNLDEVITKE